jgi:hypothetical protein
MEDYRNLKKNEIYLWEMKNGEKFLARLVEFLDDSKISVDLEISGDDRRESEYYIIHPDKARLASKVPQMSFAQFDIHTIGDTFKFTMRPRQALFPNAAMNYQTFVGRVVGTAGDTEVVSVEIDLDDEKQERVEIAVERIAFIEPVEEEEEKKEEDGYDANGNSGSLHEMQCPECGQAEEFSVIVTAQVHMDDEGYQEARNVDYDENNEASCRCGWQGTVGDLTAAYAKAHK